MTFDLIFALHIELHSLSTSTLNLVCFLRDWLAGELLTRLVGGISRRFMKSQFVLGLFHLRLKYVPSLPEQTVCDISLSGANNSCCCSLELTG